MGLFKGERVIVSYGKNMVYSGIVEDTGEGHKQYAIRFDNWPPDRNEWIDAHKVESIDRPSDNKRNRRKATFFTPEDEEPVVLAKKASKPAASSKSKRSRPSQSGGSKKASSKARSSSSSRKKQKKSEQTQKLHPSGSLDAESVEMTESEESEDTSDTSPLGIHESEEQERDTSSIFDSEGDIESTTISTPTRDKMSMSKQRATSNAISKPSPKSQSVSRTLKPRVPETTVEPYILYAATTNHPVARKKMLASIASFDKVWLNRLIALSVHRIQEFSNSSTSDDESGRHNTVLDLPLSFAVLKHLVERHSTTTDRSCSSVPAMLSLLSSILKKVSYYSSNDDESIVCLSNGVIHWFTLLCCNFIRHGIENCSDAKEWKSFLNNYAEDILIGDEERESKMVDYFFHRDASQDGNNASKRLTETVSEEIATSRNKVRRLCNNFEGYQDKSFRRHMEKTLHAKMNKALEDLYLWLHSYPLIKSALESADERYKEKYLKFARSKPLLTREQARDMIHASNENSGILFAVVYVYMTLVMMPSTGDSKAMSSEDHEVPMPEDADQLSEADDDDNAIYYSVGPSSLPEKLHIPFESPTDTPWKGLEEAPAFYNWGTTYPFLKELLRYKHVILDELDQIKQNTWPDWPEEDLYDTDSDEWKVFPLVHTFPAYDPSQTHWIESFCKHVPNTVRLLKALPGIRTALFSRLGPGTELCPHKGWGELSNYVLRCHMPLRLPSKGECGVVVGDEIRSHHKTEFVVFDDSQTHAAFNHDEDQNRIVLIFDLLRPEGLPEGQADGGTTEELENFMDYFK